MLRGLLSIGLVLGTTTFLFGQASLQQMVDAETLLLNGLATKGEKAAFTSSLTPDAVIFKPNAVNGRDYWGLQPDGGKAVVVRERKFMDMAANGLLGYTTGTWKVYPDGIDKPVGKSGAYVTVWEKRNGEKFAASLDITVEYDPDLIKTDDLGRVWPSAVGGDLNPRRWSAADPSMNFLKLSMTKKALGGAYEKFAAEDIRVLLEGDPPIVGKKQVVKATEDFVSIDYPKKTALLEASDMAYIWNPCEYANSDEGKEKGNCLHIWKLRNKKYYIVLGVLARVRNMTKPTIKVKSSSK